MLSYTAVQAGCYVYAFSITITLSAFLLFQVQPMIARYILPWFGGSPGVWTTSLLLFQVMLLLGYIYAHFLVTRFPVRRQVVVHTAFLIASLVVLPITPDTAWRPSGDEPPVLHIALLLLATVGLPYALLASSAPLLQAWIVRASPGSATYSYYALSNVGAVLGLVTYPFVVEPMVGLVQQTQFWSVGYAAFAFGSVLCGLALRRKYQEEPLQPKETEFESRPVSRLQGKRLWLTLAAVGVIVLMASTNQLCRDVIVIPLLWIVPLTLYLLSFILCFGASWAYHRVFWAVVLALSVAAVLIVLAYDYSGLDASVEALIGVYSIFVFSSCMICHGELFRARPPVTHLTSFYLCIAAGGAIGGAVVTLVSPVLFSGYWEFHASILAVIFILGACAFFDPKLRARRFQKVVVAGMTVVSIGVTGALLGKHIVEQQDATILTHRNFFGILRVTEYRDETNEQLRALHHGRIGHGDQYLASELKRLPITYYGPESGAGVAITSQRDFKGLNGSSEPMTIGVIGLGTGTVAAYGKSGDRILFYEINPAVKQIAYDYFTFLQASPAYTDVALGDGRIQLEREAAKGNLGRFDVLIVDAFSGDAIPLHLMTKEALDLYRSQIAPGGTIAYHISNLYFDLRPVVRAMADEASLHAIWVENFGDARGEDASDWVLLTSNETVYRSSLLHHTPWPSGLPDVSIWTDDYANVLATLWKE